MSQWFESEFGVQERDFKVIVMTYRAPAEDFVRAA